jgi:hypothetical protein
MKADAPSAIVSRFLTVGFCTFLMLGGVGCQSLRPTQPAPEAQGGLQPKTPAGNAWADASLYALWYAVDITGTFFAH